MTQTKKSKLFGEAYNLNLQCPFGQESYIYRSRYRHYTTLFLYDHIRLMRRMRIENTLLINLIMNRNNIPMDVQFCIKRSY